MVQDLEHDLRLSPSRDERARQDFVSTLRRHVLDDMTATLKTRYTQLIEPPLQRVSGLTPGNGAEVHQAIRNDPYFRAYSSVRYNAQEMVFGSVIPMVDRHIEALNQRGTELRAADDNAGSLTLMDGFEVPRSVSEIDVHLAPGGYHTEYGAEDMTAGAMYDNSLNVFGFNAMGANLDDIGWTMAGFTRYRYPDFRPARILDCGCTVGHNTVPWAKTFSGSEVHAIDVSAPLLRYASARAKSMSARIRFAQMNATELRYPDSHFDVVFSSMFLHELPLKDIRAYLAEANRVLRPGGLLLTMELPPNNQLAPYDQFYLDWDCYYNMEPFYKPFRDQDYRDLCQAAGFPPERFFEVVLPRYTYMEDEEFRAAVNQPARFDGDTGRLADSIRWYAFGTWKN